MPQWKLSTEFTFDAAHFIRDYDGPCGRMHGHTYRVRIEASARQLQASQYCPHPAMVADFRTLRWAKKDMLKGGLDHCVLNEVMPAGYETTAEMIAQFIHEKTSKMLSPNIHLKVCISETPDSWAEYESD